MLCIQDIAQDRALKKPDKAHPAAPPPRRFAAPRCPNAPVIGSLAPTYLGGRLRRAGHAQCRLAHPGKRMGSPAPRVAHDFRDRARRFDGRQRARGIRRVPNVLALFVLYLVGGGERAHPQDMTLCRSEPDVVQLRLSAPQIPAITMDTSNCRDLHRTRLRGSCLGRTAVSSAARMMGTRPRWAGRSSPPRESTTTFSS